MGSYTISQKMKFVSLRMGKMHYLCSQIRINSPVFGSMLALIVFGGEVSLIFVANDFGSRDNGPGPLGPTIPTEITYEWHGSRSVNVTFVAWVVKRGPENFSFTFHSLNRKTFDLRSYISSNVVP